MRGSFGFEKVRRCYGTAIRRLAAARGATFALVRGDKVGRTKTRKRVTVAPYYVSVSDEPKRA